MALISPAYCTAAEIKRFMSAQAVVDFADHDNDGLPDDEVVNDAINWACEEINSYLTEKYTTAQLATSTMVNRWAVLMAARLLCITRGNSAPEPWESEYERLVDADTGTLMRIRRGDRELPGIAKRADMRPILSNLTVDRRYPRNNVRVIRETSSDNPSVLGQDFARDIRGLP